MGPTDCKSCKYLSENSKNKILKFGAAQFDIYKKAPKIDRREFCKIHKISNEHKILLYAGGSLGTNEFEHLILFEEAIERGEFGNLNIIYRPHPWGGGGNAETDI